jgi:hypothetical protein
MASKDMIIKAKIHLTEEAVQDLLLLKRLELAVRNMLNNHPDTDDHKTFFLEIHDQLMDIDQRHGDGRALTAIAGEIEALEDLADLADDLGQA